jgi:DNA-binding NarL/FixJ family response regulator
MTAPSDVWLVEDNEALRRTAARAINQCQGLSCPRHFSNCEDALAALAREPAPEVVLLDIELPGMTGLDGLERLATIVPDAKVVVWTVFEDHDKVFRALCGGAAGYLLKTASMVEIEQAIRDVLRGGAPMNPRIARRVLDLFSRFAPHPRDYSLTPRERDIIEVMIAGATKKEIASALAVSYHTVDSHLRSIYQKLHVTTRQAAVAKALKHRLV